MAYVRKALKCLVEYGPAQLWNKYQKARRKRAGETQQEKAFHILLLTNRDSDNLGDQVIEACDIALISAAMKNLGVANFKIQSRAAGIISQKYLATRDAKLLDPVRRAISKSDVIVFGGAPLFNYSYQVFYERTAVTLELAQEYNKPVIFSAVGVEEYDGSNKKCQRLKKTLNFECVRQITTRDDFDSLQKFIEDDRIVVDKVSDPAVFTRKVFEDFLRPRGGQAEKIGVFVIRANAFVDNGYEFSSDDAAALWLDLINKLEQSNLDYELLTSGHFGDEAFLDCLIREYGVDAKKCIFNMNTPEQLVEKISSYDAIISCRLHPSIIAFSLGVPSLGIVWNSKVGYFYDAIGCTDRAINIDGVSGGMLVDRLNTVIEEGITKDETYLLSVYTKLFDALCSIIKPDKPDCRSYSYSELLEIIPPFQGTSEKAKNEKIKRKFRRAYNEFNGRAKTNRKQKERIIELEEQLRKLSSE